MHGKTIWKPGIGKIAKASRGIAPGPNKGGFQRPIWTPSCNSQHADARRVMAYSHKTQSFMKTEVSKSAWIKPCYIYIYIYIIYIYIYIYI